MVYDRIDQLCKLHGVTIKSLESSVGLSNGSIAKWRRSSPRVESLQAVADYFGVTLDFLSKGG